MREKQTVYVHVASLHKNKGGKSVRKLENQCLDFKYNLMLRIFFNNRAIPKKGGEGGSVAEVHERVMSSHK